MKESLEENILIELKAIRLLLERYFQDNSKNKKTKKSFHHKNNDDGKNESLDKELSSLMTHFDIDWTKDEQAIAIDLTSKIAKQYGNSLYFNYGATRLVIFMRLSHIIRQQMTKNETNI